MFEWITWENPVAIWWIALSTAGVFNILLWTWTKVYKYRTHSVRNFSKLWNLNENIIWFSALYTFVCAFRSWLPRADVQRICLWDTWFSSVMLGRTIATVAELAFVAQWMIVLKFYGKETNSPITKIIAISILPIITVAEICSWYAVVRTHYIGNVIEESLWAVTYALIGIAICFLVPKLKGALKLAATFAIVGCCLYVAFMVLVDVPMYIERWQADIASQKEYLNLWTGLVDLNTRWHVTYSIDDWKTEIPWQTLYFTFAVLVSIALCYVPLSTSTASRYLKQKN